MDKTEERNLNMELWESRIQAREKSGMTIEKWCESNDIPEGQYYYWKKQIQKGKEPLEFYTYDLNEYNQKRDSGNSITIRHGDWEICVGSEFNAHILKEVLAVVKDA